MHYFLFVLSLFVARVTPQCCPIPQTAISLYIITILIAIFLAINYFHKVFLDFINIYDNI